MNTAYILTGGNMGEREKYLNQAIELIRLNVGNVISTSSIYETAPWGKQDQPTFLNQVLIVETKLLPTELLTSILSIEKKLGRERFEKMGPRTIDIDILFYNDLILKTPTLVIPHPQIEKRRFVLTPLVEIAEDLKHPVLNQSMKVLLEVCPDHLPVNKLIYPGNFYKKFK